MGSTLAIDIGALIGLFALSTLIRSRFTHHGYSATSAGSIVMAIGIFSDFALPRLPFYTPLLGRLVTIEVFVIWLFLAGSFLTAAWNRHFRMHYAHPMRRFAIGTWVAGTAVLSDLITHAMPEVARLGQILTLIAVAIYLPYVAVFVRGYIRLWRHPLKQKANGIILLATVSTQSIVIALHVAFGPGFPAEIAIGMLAFDVLFFCSGIVLIALHYYTSGNGSLAIEWKNANCIIHGAVSITGLALVLTSSLNVDVLIGVWAVAWVLFVGVETIELIRMLEREHRRGFRAGLLVYDVTQWTRNFTYGMFYAFSLALHRAIPASHSVERDLWYLMLHAVAEYGQYIVLAFLLLEIFIFLRARLYRYREPSATGST